MKIITIHIEIEGEEIVLSNARAAFWPRNQMLIISDLHVGKTAHFRKSGISIPSDIMQNDLKRLNLLINHFEPQKILIAGDLFHAEYNSDLMAFINWLDSHKNIEFILVQGNHDKKMVKRLKEMNICLYDKYYSLLPFRFVHNPAYDTNEFCICGHLHPGILIKTAIRQHLKYPCYILTSHVLYLPAFSNFTGLNTSVKGENFRYFPFTSEGIYEV